MVVKGTGLRLSPKNLLIAWIWSPWAAAPIRQPALCSVSLFHAAFYRTFSVNHKKPGSLGHSAFKLCPWKEESGSISGRLGTQFWAACNSFLSPVLSPLYPGGLVLWQAHIWHSILIFTSVLTVSWCTYTAHKLIFKKYIWDFFFLSCMLLGWENAYLHRNNLE